MSRYDPNKQQRKAAAKESAALLERKRIWVKPERLLLGINRLGDPVFGGRTDSTVKCANSGSFRECKPKIVDEIQLRRKPLGLVDERITQETKAADVKAHQDMLAQNRVIKKLSEPAPKHGDAMVRIGTTPARTIMMMGDDGEMKFPKIPAKPRFVPVGTNDAIPNCQSASRKGKQSSR